MRKAVEISDQVKKQTAFYKLFDFCRDKVPMTVALRIYNQFGDNAIEVLKDNPYRLCGEINGFAFSLADSIAIENGYNTDGRERIYGATVQVLKRAAETGGHSCLPVKAVINEVSELIGIDAKVVGEAEKDFALSGEIGYLHKEGGSLLYLPEYLSIEKGIASALVSLDKRCIRYNFSDMAPMVHRVEAENGIQFAKEQRDAIFEAADSGVMLITGGPGTGKTTIIKALINIYKSMGCDIALAAPTGRAAKRMSEATSYEAKTIHRLLEVEFREEDDAHTVFVRNERNMLDEDIIIVDEASMLDMFLLYALLRAIRPGSRLVLIGDCDQLPSVGAGNVLRDLLESNVFNTVRLTKVFRQENESLIVANAHRINNGEKPILDRHDMDFFFMHRNNGDELVSTIVDLCVSRLPNSYGVTAFDKIQLVSPTKKGAFGTESLNKVLQSKLNPPTKDKLEKKHGETVFRIGDKVMQIRNNYDLVWLDGGKERFGIYNGDMGIIKKISNSHGGMTIDFDGREVEYSFELLEDLELAYAITVHKSQGSEYPFVVMPVADFMPMLMTRNLLYTAVTRAKAMVILVGKESSLMQMVENEHVSVRYTGLKLLLEAANA